MMRKILSAIVIIILIALCIPAVVGIYLKRVVMNELATASLPKGYKITLDSYHNGWFTSEAQLTLGINSAMPLSSSDTHEVVINANIAHGPFTFTKNLQNLSQFFMGLGVVKGIAQISDLPLQVYAKVRFNKDIDITAIADNYKHQKAGDDVNLSINNITSNILLSNHFTKVAGNSSVTNFTVADPESRLFIPTVTSTFNLVEDNSGVWVGNKYNTVPSVNYYQNNTNLLNLSGITLNTTTQIINQLFSAKVSAQIQKIMPLNYQIFGPANLNYSINNINAQTMNEFNQFISNTNFSDAKNNQQLSSGKLFLYIAKLLQGTTQTLNNFSLTTPRGNMIIAAKVAIPPMNIDVNQPTTTALISSLAMQLASQSDSNLYIIVPTQFVLDTMNKLMPGNQTWMNYLTMLNNAGIVKSDGSNLSTQMIYTPTSSSVNGVPISTAFTQFQVLLQQFKAQQTVTAVQQTGSTIPAATNTTNVVNPSTSTPSLPETIKAPATQSN